MTTEQAINEIVSSGYGQVQCHEETMRMAVDALRAQRERENQKPQWISVKDRLPEKTGSYLVFYHEWSGGAFLPTYEDFEIRVMRFLNSRKWCYPVCVDKRCEADTNREVTHWMPLPNNLERMLGEENESNKT